LASRSVPDQPGWRRDRHRWQRLLRPDGATTSDSRGVHQNELAARRTKSGPPGDFERTFSLTGHGDLLRNTGWLAAARRNHGARRWRRVPGSIRLGSRRRLRGATARTTPNPNAQHGWLESTCRLGPRTVSLLSPDVVKAKSVGLLRAGSMIPFRSDGGTLRFTIPGVEDYEVAAITVG
jgi:hypothetical protein